MAYQAYNNEVEVQSVLILDENDSPIIDLATIYADNKISLDFLTLTESLSSPMMDGSIVFDGTQGDYEFMQLVGNETLVITLKTPDEEDTETESITLPKFSIYGFQDSSNFSETNKTPEGFTIRKVTINFCSKDAKELYETPDLLPSGFIGKISSGLTFEGASGESEGEENEDGEETPVEELIDKRGLVEIVSESLDGGIDSEATLNDVWIKPKLISLPNRKFVEGMNTLQMLNYCKGYSVSADNPSAVNYCFWQDLAGFHFKSIDLLSYESQSKEEYNTFTLNSNIIGKNRIYKFDVISDFSFYSLLSANALYAYYDRYEPDFYSSPYARLMDDREKFTKKRIVYNYKDVYAGLYPIEQGDPFPFITSDELSDLENDELSINDIVFGYQEDRAFNDQDKIRSVLLMGNELEVSGGSGDDTPDEPDGVQGLFAFAEGVSGSSGDIETDLSHFNVYETNKWQSMFDCVDMDGESLKKIINEIKLPTFKAKREYRDRLAYKEQWNIYKYSVCCTSPQVEDSGFMAVVKNTHLVGRNIWRYSWNEVIFIPKVELANFAGATGPTADYSLDTQALNQIELTAGSNWDNLTISKYGVEVDTPFTVGDLSGEIRIQGTTCGITFENENSVTRVLETYLQCDIEGTTAGVTLAFHNDEWSPFLVVEKPNGARGLTTDYSGAYNLNEVLNRATYNDDPEEGYEDIAGACGGSVLHYQDFNRASGILPDVTEEVDILIGPGINANKENTDYPSGFASMPVGSYQRLNTDDDGNAQPGVQCKEIPMGHVVKIQAIKTKDLPSYGININSPDIKTVYYFNSTNAQDGDCNTTSDCPIGDNRS